MQFKVGDIISCNLGECEIIYIESDVYIVKHTSFGFIGKYKEEDIFRAGMILPRVFKEKELPNFLVVDDFYENPMQIREFALMQDFSQDSRFYKGKRSKKFLFESIKERFEELLGCKIKNWLLNDTANGCFQITNSDDPLVYHSDIQSYAAVVYLTPGASIENGTSFWKDKKYGCRTSPFDPLEKDKFSSDEEREIAHNEIYNNNSNLNADCWELVDRFSPVFNRLVIWNGKLIHSATGYENYNSEIPECNRLVQLFFFDIEDM